MKWSSIIIDQHHQLFSTLNPCAQNRLHYDCCTWVSEFMSYQMKLLCFSFCDWMLSGNFVHLFRVVKYDWENVEPKVQLSYDFGRQWSPRKYMVCTKSCFLSMNFKPEHALDILLGIYPMLQPAQLVLLTRKIKFYFSLYLLHLC